MDCWLSKLNEVSRTPFWPHDDISMDCVTAEFSLQSRTHSLHFSLTFHDAQVELQIQRKINGKVPFQGQKEPIRISFFRASRNTPKFTNDVISRKQIDPHIWYYYQGSVNKWFRNVPQCKLTVISQISSVSTSLERWILFFCCRFFGV